MKIIVTTEDELQQMINKAIDKTFKELLPKAIRQASRKEWLTTTEVMEFLECSRRHVQHLRDTNRITFHQKRRTIRYHIDDVEEYLNRGKVQNW